MITLWNTKRTRSFFKVARIVGVQRKCNSNKVSTIIRNSQIEFNSLTPTLQTTRYIPDSYPELNQQIYSLKSPWNSQHRCFHLTPQNDLRRDQQPHKPPFPRLFYVQSPLVWFTNKMDFRFLRKNWDPEFSEEEFSRGAKQAISTITQLINTSKFSQMKNLLTKSAMINLRTEIELLWPDEIRRNIALKPEDVQLFIPRKLHFRQGQNTINVQEGNIYKLGRKLCDIDVVFIALKWIERHQFQNLPTLLFIEIIARFHRNYTQGSLPEWTVAAFKLRKFNVLPSK